VIVQSTDRRSLVLTATHVIAGAASIRIDVSRDLHDVPAAVDRTGPRDLTLLRVERGGLHAARFAPRTHPVVEGNLVAVAGYVKNDELIGVVGQEPRILFPGTVADRPENGLYLELENVHIEEGLSGGAVFDPGTGDVLGIVTSRTSDQRGGFADSGALVVLPFLDRSLAAARPPAPPAPRIALAAVHAAAAAPVAIPVVHTVFVLPSTAPRPAPSELTVIARLNAVPVDSVSEWQASGAAPKRFIAMRSGCRMAVTIDVQTLQFVIAHQALVSPHHGGSLLSIALQRRVGTTDACADMADAEPTDGSYTPTAMSFDGHHVTMRFVYSGAADNVDLFPSDASLDADISGDAATATVQFFDRDWSGSIALALERTALASVSSTW